MAGRGRGGGKAVSFDVEQLGFSKGEKLPAPILEPPPLFPPANRPVPLQHSEETKYLLALKQKFRTDFQASPFFIKHDEKKPSVERYSDKYHKTDAEKYPYSWQLFPAELRPVVKKKTAKRKGVMLPSEAGSLKTIDVLGENEHKSVKRAIVSDDEDENDKEGAEDDQDDEGLQEAIDDEDEEIEDETDYGASYFDNGEAFLDPEDDNLEDGPVY